MPDPAFHLPGRLVDVEMSLPPGEEVASRAELLSLMDSYGIDIALVHGATADAADIEAGNTGLFAVVAESRRLFASPTVDAREVDENHLAELRESGARAVRIHPRKHAYGADARSLARLMNALSALRLPLFIDFDTVHWSEYEVDYTALADLCTAWPDVPIVLARRSLADVAGLYEAWDRVDNLYAEMSYYCVADGLRHAAERGWAGRFLFGSGLPVYEGLCPICSLGWAGIGDLDRGRIASGSAADLLGLDLPAESVPPMEPHGLRIIDAHGHIGPAAELLPTCHTADALADALRRCGISRSVITSLPALQGDPEGGHAAKVEALARYPDLFLGYVDVDPREGGPGASGGQGGLAEIVSRRLSDPGMVGLKIHCDFSGVPLSDGAWGPALRVADERRLPVLVHGIASPDQAADVCARYPGLLLIAAHAASFPFDLALPWVELASKLPGFYVDTCGSVCGRGALGRLVERCGVSGVLFATDCCYLDAAYELGRVLSLALRAAGRDALLCGNIEGLLER